MSVNKERTNVTKMQNAKTPWENIFASAELDITAVDGHVKVCIAYLRHILFSVPLLLQ